MTATNGLIFGWASIHQPSLPMKKIWNRLKTFWYLIRDTYKKWNDREPFTNSAIIAYYTIFSLPGLLVIVINIAGYFYGTDEVTRNVAGQIESLTGGGDTAEDIKTIIAKASATKGTTLASIIGIATLLYGATGIFYQVQQILNKIWEVKPKARQKFLKLIKDRLFSFGLVLAVAFLMLVSLILSTLLSAFSQWVTRHMSDSLNFMFKAIDILLSVGIITLLFAAIFKFLPDAQIKWRYVWSGAFLTSVLFVAAKFALGFYFGKSNPASTYGAAGSIVLIMLWVSYAGLILLYGAQFTKVYADRFAPPVPPSDHAESTHGEPEKHIGDLKGNHA